jgi:hypothetical protein
MDEVFKSSRFWISMAVIASVTLLACLNIVSGDMAVGTMTGLVGGFGIGKAWMVTAADGTRVDKMGPILQPKTGSNPPSDGGETP